MNLSTEQWYIYQKKKPVELESYEQKLVRKQMQTMYEILQKQQKEKIKPLVIDVKKPRKRGGTRRKEKHQVNRREFQQALKESLDGNDTVKEIAVNDTVDDTVNATEKHCRNEACDACKEYDNVELEKTEDDIELEERIYRDLDWVLEEAELSPLVPLDSLPKDSAQLDPVQLDLFLQTVFLEELLGQYVSLPTETSQFTENIIPENTAPINTVPVNTAPVNTAPVNTVSVNTVPTYTASQYTFSQYTMPYTSQYTIPQYTIPQYTQYIPQYTIPYIPQYTIPHTPHTPHTPHYTRVLPHKERTHTATNGYTYWNLGASKFIPSKKRPYRMM